MLTVCHVISSQILLPCTERPKQSPRHMKLSFPFQEKAAELFLLLSHNPHVPSRTAADSWFPFLTEKDRLLHVLIRYCQPGVPWAKFKLRCESWGYCAGDKPAQPHGTFLSASRTIPPCRCPKSTS
jgi:hypothetical protein